MEFLFAAEAGDFRYGYTSASNVFLSRKTCYIINILYFCNIMGTLEAFLVILAVISGGLVIWSYTKSGKKWLNSL